MKTLYKTLALIAAALVTAAFIWGAYAVSKNLSYKWWYRDMVEETVMEVLEREGLME